MRVGVIGDIHGHYREMLSIVRKLERHGVDRIIMLGDLCDRGPSSLRCLRYIQSKTFLDRSGSNVSFECVRGNHEDGYVRAWRKIPKPGRVTVSSPEEPITFRQLPVRLLRWMERLPVLIRVPELNLVCVHGGVTPHRESLEHESDFMLRTRYLNEDGTAYSGLLGNLFWAEVYDGRFGTIAFGHESHLRPTAYEHAVAVDGEGFNKVHAAVFSDEPRENRVTSFSCPYRGRSFEEDISRDPIRYYSLDGRVVRRGNLL